MVVLLWRCGANLVSRNTADRRRSGVFRGASGRPSFSPFRTSDSDNDKDNDNDYDDDNDNNNDDNNDNDNDNNNNNNNNNSSSRRLLVFALSVPTAGFRSSGGPAES